MSHPLRRRPMALLCLGLVAQLYVAIPIAYAGDTPPPPRAFPPPPPPPLYAVPVEPPPPPPPPPPLSPAMRVVYAPFYAAGLVLRYGLYYVVVAPFEVFGRALSYGVDGGVDGREVE